MVWFGTFIRAGSTAYGVSMVELGATRSVVDLAGVLRRRVDSMLTILRQKNS
jgi:hypothetical protein